MDHRLYDYSALPSRTRFQWADGRGLAAYVLLFLEHWELTPPANALRDPRMAGEYGSFAPDYRSWSQREYGLRVGIFRAIDALREVGLRPVVAANAMALQRLPALVQLFNDWGCEWVAHGDYATRMMHANMDLPTQRATINGSIEAVLQATGQRPQGWLSQDWGTTPDTPALLAAAGIGYTLDWCNDDQPYWMHTEPPLLSIPLSSEWDDVQCQWLRNLEPRAHTELAVAAFERLRQECAQQQRAAVFALSIHPWLSAMPSRIGALRTLLARLRAHSDVLWTTPGALLASTPRSQNSCPPTTTRVPIAPATTSIP